MFRLLLCVITLSTLPAGAAFAQDSPIPAPVDSIAVDSTAAGAAAADSSVLASPAVTAPAPVLPAPAPAPVPLPASTTPSAGIADLGPNSPMPARPHLVLPRSESQIRAERDQMQAVATGADGEVLSARKAQVEAKARVEVKEREIEVLNARAKAAKQAKADADKSAIEAARKLQDKAKSCFEREEDVTSAAVEESEARRDWARAAMRLCDAESRLVGRAGVAANDGDPALFKLEQQYLEAVKVRGQAQEKYANKLQALADRKLKVYSAWVEYMGGK